MFLTLKVATSTHCSAMWRFATRCSYYSTALVEILPAKGKLWTHAKSAPGWFMKASRKSWARQPPGTAKTACQNLFIFPELQAIGVAFSMSSTSGLNIDSTGSYSWGLVLGLHWSLVKRLWAGLSIVAAYNCTDDLACKKAGSILEHLCHTGFSTILNQHI